MKGLIIITCWNSSQKKKFGEVVGQDKGKSFSIYTPYIFGYTQIFLKVIYNTKIALLYKFS